MVMSQISSEGDTFNQVDGHAFYFSGIGDKIKISGALVAGPLAKEFILYNNTGTVVADIETEARNVIIRNNVFDDSLGNGTVAVLYEQRNTYVPAPSDVRIYNNTVYTTNTSSQAFNIGAEVANCRVRNNLFAVPSVSSSLIGGGGGSGWVADHNLITASPGFTNAAGGDFSLASGSPAANQGTTLPEVREDSVRGPRPLGSAFDLGAFESR